ncbi:MAG TPA: hypothetical protein DCM68_04285 [Verrucomicrobia bacterium]|nr:hypothetical protein [Verrucomicrobiota bacterium]
MKEFLPALFLLAAATGFAAPEVTRNDARHASYVRLVPATPGTAFADADQRQIIRLLVERAATPVTPNDVIPEDKIAEINFGPVMNRPAEFGAENFFALWRSNRLQNVCGPAEISLAPDSGFVILKDGKVIPFDLYGGTSLRLFGFLFRQP